MTHLRAIAQRPRPSGSAEHARVREYLVTRLRALGLEPRIQETTGIGTRNPVVAHVLNVLARLPGRNPGGPAVLLAAHYDGVPAGPAAGDDAAGVAALLETLRALRSAPPLAHDVIILLSDGEEAGLTGAAAFVREHPWARDVALILNFEGRGTGGPSQMFETGAGNLDAVRTLRRAPGAVGSSLAVTVYRALPNDTDLSELLALGQPALNFSIIHGFERYHTASDDLAHLDPGSVQHHGEQALALTRAFADGVLPRPRTGDAVFFTIPGLGMVVYPERFAMPLAVATAALVLFGGVRLRRRPQWLRDVCLGVVGILVATGLGATAAFGVNRALERTLGAPPPSGWSGSPGLYAAGIALLALALAGGCWALVRRWASPAGAHLGALLVWTAVVMVVTWRLPGASFLFAWPLLAAAAAALLAPAGEKTRVPYVTDWAATLAAASVIVPTVYIVAVVVFAMAGPGAPLIGLFVPFSTWLLAPRLEALTVGPRWATPLVALAGALALVAIAVAAMKPSAAHPQPTMLAYALDADTKDAWLATFPEYARPGSWGAATLGPSARLVVPRHPLSDAPPEWLTRAIGSESRTLAAPAPRIAVGAPELKVLADSSTAGGRRLTLRVRPSAGTYSIRLRAIDTPVLSAAVDGRAIDPSRYRTPSPEWTLGYVDPPVEGFALTLTVSNESRLELDAIARSLGLPQVLQGKIPPRPEGVVPIHAGDQTVVHRRVRF